MYRELNPTNSFAQIIQEAELWGVNEIEVEYNDGHEEVFFRDGNISIGFKKFKSTSKAADELRKTLYDLKKIKNIKILRQAYKIKIKVFNSFGEDMFKITFQKV